MAKLEFEIVPDSCWYSNLRSILSKSAWDIVRRDAYERAGHRCSICGRAVKRLEAHERWEYDDVNHIQRLTDVVALCYSCHSVVHIGRTELVGDIDKAIDWYCKVNKCTYAEYKIARAEANRIHLERNKVDEWKLDLSWLKRYGEND